ncbi:MAG: excinuclease ABC subunit UvrA [Candidatus Dojkabacteria bacterium]|nr:excinuclease ABC subunit UvrA [Candidatus Dojkabacteria bacterium]
MSIQFIKIRGARTNNLKNIDVDIPLNSLTVITGVSGSGKSSLAFDTLYAEGQRRYVESLSPYARQFLGLMDKPDVDLIEGLSPAISIDQKMSSHNPRSTVGTITEIYDYLRLLFARIGHPRSPVTAKRLQKQTVQQVVDNLLSYPTELSRDEIKIVIFAPLVKQRKGTYEELFRRLYVQGYQRVRIDGQIYSLEEDIQLDKFQKHDIDLVIDRIVLKNTNDDVTIKRLTDSVELAFNVGNGELYVNILDLNDDPSFLEFLSCKNVLNNRDIFFSEKLVDPDSGISLQSIEPNLFSFNTPYGACEKCSGLGIVKEVDITNVYNPRLSILEGGIYPWNRLIENKNSVLYLLLQEISKSENLPLNVPIKELSQEHFNLIMFGTDKKYKLIGPLQKVYEVSFEGVVQNLYKKYYESDSDFVRDEIEKYMVEKTCPVCRGFRLKKEALMVTISSYNIIDLCNVSIQELFNWIKQLRINKYSVLNLKSRSIDLIFNTNINLLPEDDSISNSELEIGKLIFKEIETRLEFLLSVGLEYLTLGRTANTLSGGELQRIRLASQIGTGLSGVLYVLDEPSIGLHQRDNEKLINMLQKLKELNNTVVVVEHDEDTIRNADFVIDMGPGAGEQGGNIVIAGTVNDVLNSKQSLTGMYMRRELRIDKSEILKLSRTLLLDKYSQDVSDKSKKLNSRLVFRGVTHNNLKCIDVEIPLGRFVCVTGVSGSGKSSLVNEVIYKALAKKIYGAKDSPGDYKEMIGIEHIDKVIQIDQNPIGRTPRSNPATYVGIFTHIRDLFAETKEAKSRGYTSGRFSFNVKGGRCEKCEGAGVIRISMQFLPDVYIKCDECDGKRYNRETLQIDYKGKNIHQILDMSVDEAIDFFSNIPSIYYKLETLRNVGLGYIRLGQQATTLSGGESQRIKLAAELCKKQTGKTLYILDEPTIGLHFDDVKKLLILLHQLVLLGNTVLVIEHNLDVIKTADWIIDLGPEGGDSGGYIVAEGTVKDIIDCEQSYTGKYLKKILS